MESDVCVVGEAVGQGRVRGEAGSCEGLGEGTRVTGGFPGSEGWRGSDGAGLFRWESSARFCSGA
jgi:hypothetical protein